MKLPESLYFLRPGWWLLHVASVAAVFAAGFFVSHQCAVGDEHGGGGEPNHAEHAVRADHAEHADPSEHAAHGAAHQDHTAPDVLQPLMRQMLADTVQLQSDLAQGDLASAAVRADAIAGACDDSGEEAHGALPERLGPSFVELDRTLHGSASRLGEALRSGRRDDALSLNREMVSACQSCHAQAPAASQVDLRVVASFVDTLANPMGGEQ